MTHRDADSARTSEELLRRWFPLILLAVSLWLSALLIAPFAGPFFAAVVVAAALAPLQKRGLRLFGGRHHVAAGSVTLLASLLVILPLAVIGFQVWHQLGSAYTWLVRMASTGRVEAIVDPLLDALQEPA